jgi:NADH-quinone oxidoreductase subunit J
MTPVLLLLGLSTLLGAAAAMTSRRLVHCALWLVVANVGLAGLYLWLDAQFVGLVQVLVYVGAVAILIVFAILLTRGADLPQEATPGLSRVTGLGVAALVTGGLVAAVGSSGLLAFRAPPGAVHGSEASVRAVGQKLMTELVLPLEVIALLLTAALIGAVILAMPGESRHAKGEVPTGRGGKEAGQ